MKGTTLTTRRCADPPAIVYGGQVAARWRAVEETAQAGEAPREARAQGALR
jgi:hypothetical protein